MEIADIPLEVQLAATIDLLSSSARAVRPGTRPVTQPALLRGARTAERLAPRLKSARKKDLDSRKAICCPPPGSIPNDCRCLLTALTVQLSRQPYDSAAPYPLGPKRSFEHDATRI